MTQPEFPTAPPQRRRGETVGSDLAAARREAEEALREWGIENERANSDRRQMALYACAKALRSLLAASEPAADHDRICELESLLRECNAVCMCGCPDADHEADECGESCGHDDHECLRVAPAVLEIVQRYRVALSRALATEPAAALPEEVREAAEIVSKLVSAMGRWATDEDGLPMEAFDAFNEAKKFLASRGGRS